MNDTTGTDPTGWHASPALLAAYAENRADEADSWSVEAHLIGCASCRAELATALPSDDMLMLDGSRQALLAQLPQQLSLRRRSLSPLRWVMQPSMVIAVVVAVAAVTLFDVVTAVSGAATGSILWLLAPAIPMVGVALAAADDDDPGWEAILAAPSAPLRLALWRTLAVLAIAVPLAALAGLARAAAGGDPGWNAAWLLPCAALTATTLAAGSYLGMERAARASVVLWCAVTLGLPLVRTGGNVMAGVNLAATPLAETAVFGAAAQPVWAAGAGIAAVILIFNRERIQLVHPDNWSR